MVIHKNSKSIVIAIIIFFTILLFADRYYWAEISQWREDQATNIWLGYTSDIGNMPVGLISSKDIPNPNGMIILGSILSILPNLLSVSFFLSMMQMFLVALIGWRSFDKDPQHLALATIPLLFSIVLRSSSVEFWNQYFITLLNIFFIFWAVKYLQDRSLWNFPPIIILILLAPSLYLAGIVNAIVMTIITLVISLYLKPKTDHLWQVLFLTLVIISSSIALTWRPYFQNVSVEQLIDYNKARLGGVAMFKTAWETLFSFPIYASFQWADRTIYPLAIKHADFRILSPISQLLVKTIGRTYLAQAIFAFITFSYALFSTLQAGKTEKEPGNVINPSIAKVIIISVAFIVISYTVSSWMGGPIWMDGERPDQNVQFLPMFLLIIFLLPRMVIISNRVVNKVIKGISFILLIAFGLSNLLGGIGIIQDHLQYRGDVLTEADVPLINKAQAIDFIATDWKTFSNSSTIAVDYELGGEVWDWVPEFGQKLQPWYPAPMTDGRSFDYELLRRYNLTNQQEGVQIRSFGTGRYLVTYAFEEPPQVENKKIEHYIFGRLRVSVVEE